MAVSIADSVKVISFDLDDTLWSGPQVILHAEQVMLNWMQQHTPKVLNALDQNQLRQRKIEFIKSNPQFAHKVSAAREHFLQSLFHEFEYPQAKALAQQCFAAFYQARQQVELFEAVLPTLETLKQKYRLIAITNGNADIALTGLDHVFEFCLQGEEFDKPKPHPQIFEHALSRLDVSAHEVLHVGDHPVQDMLGAHEAGLQTCWLDDGSREWQQSFTPHAVITHVRELIAQ
ncbi:MAG: HAD family hydrolase [Gammaproteobacteria bacterium]|nr:HAD family hydrolase [Gammaproteobacteria bacterium]